MQALRDLLRTSLAQSLAALTPLDRLGAAWPVAAGHAVSERSSVIGLDEGVATVLVADSVWLAHLRAARPQLLGDLSRVSRIPLTDILFVLTTPDSPGREGPPRGAGGHTRTSSRKRV